MQQLFINVSANQTYNCSEDIKENLFLCYGLKDNNDCLTKEVLRYKNNNIISFSLLSVRILFFDYLTKLKNPKNDYFDNFITDLKSFDQCIPKNCDLLKVLRYYFLYIIYKYDSSLVTENNIPADIYLDFINNNLLITTSDSILTSEDEIKQFIIQNIYNYNLNEIFLSKEIANSLIEWIKSK